MSSYVRTRGSGTHKRLVTRARKWLTYYYCLKNRASEMFLFAMNDDKLYIYIYIYIYKDVNALLCIKQFISRSRPQDA